MSDLLSEEGAQELLELVPHAQLVDVAGAGHMVAGDRNDLFNDAVVDFLDDVKDHEQLNDRDSTRSSSSSTSTSARSRSTSFRCVHVDVPVNSRRTTRRSSVIG